MDRKKLKKLVKFLMKYEKFREYMQGNIKCRTVFSVLVTGGKSIISLKYCI